MNENDDESFRSSELDQSCRSSDLEETDIIKDEKMKTLRLIS